MRGGAVSLAGLRRRAASLNFSTEKASGSRFVAARRLLDFAVLGDQGLLMKGIERIKKGEAVVSFRSRRFPSCCGDLFYAVM